MFSLFLRVRCQSFRQRDSVRAGHYLIQSRCRAGGYPKKASTRSPYLRVSQSHLVVKPATQGNAVRARVPEVGDVRRFSSIKKAISYFGLCGAGKSSVEAVKRTPLSKQRNKHLQNVLIEAAK